MTPEAQLKHALEIEADDIFKTEMAQCKATVEANFQRWVEEHAKEEAAKYTQIHNQLTEVQQQLNALTELFKQGKTALVVIKYLGYLAAAVWAVIVWSKDHLKV